MWTVIFSHQCFGVGLLPILTILAVGTLHVRNLDLVGSSDTQGTEIIYQIAGSSKAKDLSLLLTYLLGLALILDELSQGTKSQKKNIIKMETDFN